VSFGQQRDQKTFDYIDLAHDRFGNLIAELDRLLRE
jgi:hypothetical protein